ncbi:MAG: 6-phosphogluconate dehydrogenase [Candidatus Azotimanducaceae bacterium]|jgi:6-phosphogluconate dehydrogenase
MSYNLINIMEEHKVLAFIGLGRMGAAMSAHLVESGYTVHGFDMSEEARSESQNQGVTVHDSLTECIEALPESKLVWIMVPSQFVDDVIDDVKGSLKSGDCIIDGGNSFFQQSLSRHQALEGDNIDFIDCGTSGGVEGARYGASLMVGGDNEAIQKHKHVFQTLAMKDGYGHVGGPGAGHFVKMVHNGIEYGMMGAIAEGLNVLHEHKEGMGLNIGEAIKAYEHGSIIESNLLSWFADAYEKEGHLETIAGKVPKGETEMEMEYLVSNNHLRILNAAITQRKLTRVEPSLIGTYIAAMRNEFGGHKTIQKKLKPDEN